MAKRAAVGWRGRFLRALALSGNVQAAAAVAGMDPGTAYHHRIKDPAFAARMEAARAKGKARAAALAAAGKADGPLHRLRRSPSPGKPGEELIARTSVHGTQLVRVGPGRWCAAAEAAFRAELRRTGCVRAAARACGFSTNALYKRRKNYPDFAAAWAADEAAAGERIPALLSAAAIAALDPEVAAEEGVPAVDVGQAIAICRLKGFGAAGRAGCGPAGRTPIPSEPPIEAVRASIMRKLDAIEAHEARKASRHAPGEAEGD